jgi:NADH-quinone oxidoreductase subunit M
MLAAIIVYGLSEGTFDLVKIGASSSDWIFLGFVAAFAIKAPLFPCTVAARRLSRIVARGGGACSRASSRRRPRTASCASRSRSSPSRHRTSGADPRPRRRRLVYGSLLAFRAPDLRGVIAYSSLAQIGPDHDGRVRRERPRPRRAVLQMVNHGLISAALFLLAGWSSGER